MARKHRTPDEAIQQSPHVLYEIQMLGALRVHFLKGDHDRAVRPLPLDGLASRNALVESFQVHARQLIDFLTDKRDERESIASDFVASNWSIPEADVKSLKKLGGEFSQRVAHLSWRRSGAKSMPAAVLTEDIFAAIRDHLFLFLERVDRSRVEDGFVKEARDALADPPKSEKAVDFFNAVSPSVTAALTAATVSLSPSDLRGTATHMLRPETPE